MIDKIYMYTAFTLWVCLHHYLTTAEYFTLLHTKIKFSKYIRRKRSNFEQRNFYFPQFISKWNRKTQNSGEKLKTVAEKIKPWRKFFFAMYVFRKISYSMSNDSWVPQTRCGISHFRCSYKYTISLIILLMMIFTSINSQVFPFQNFSKFYNFPINDPTKFYQNEAEITPYIESTLTHTYI